MDISPLPQVFQLCFNLNRIHECWESINQANQGHVTANSHALSASFEREE
jgi:hypothetical protein